ncbi:MAG TPA: hypothetical protein PK280_11525 [Planctomycetota bacterium]|nr:hypothetical protein [Planctomycetota bacterium]
MATKLVLIAYGSGLEPDVAEVIARSGASGYTRWERAAGSGRSGGTHLDTHVWPDFNHVTAVVADEAVAARIMAGVRDLRLVEGARGVKAFLLPVEEVT